MKIRLVGAQFFHVDGQTDMTKQIVALRAFAKAPKSKPWIKGFRQGLIKVFLTDMVNIFHHPNFHPSQNF
jgi:predicted metal-dependent hydrolase